jgi:hypothetical protein
MPLHQFHTLGCPPGLPEDKDSAVGMLTGRLTGHPQQQNVCPAASEAQAASSSTSNVVYHPSVEADDTIT